MPKENGEVQHQERREDTVECKQEWKEIHEIARRPEGIFQRDERGTQRATSKDRLRGREQERVVFEVSMSDDRIPDHKARG